LAEKFREITNKAENLIEQGREADDRVNYCQSQVSSAAAQVRAAEYALSGAMETDEEGNPRGDVHSAQVQLRMAQGQQAAVQRALTAAEDRVAAVKGEKDRHVQKIEQHTRVSQENLKKVEALRGQAFSADMAPLAAGIVERLNLAEEAKVKLLESMGITATADLYTLPDSGASDSYAGRGGNFAPIDLNGTLSGAGSGSGGSEGAVSGWSGIGDRRNGMPGTQSMGGMTPAQGPLSGSAAAGLTPAQQSQMADLRNQYMRDSESNLQVTNAVLTGDGLTTAEKREALLGLRNELTQLQNNLLNAEQGIRGGGNALVLKVDNANEMTKEYTDNPYNEDGTLKPNVEYTTGEYDYCYETDNQSRITSFRTDDLQLTERENRLPHNGQTPDKGKLDDAGHLIGDRFGGSSELDNLVSQDSHINRGEYKAMENEWATALQNGCTVQVAGDVSYDGDSHRPTSFDVFYAIDDEVYERSFLNRRD